MLIQVIIAEKSIGIALKVIIVIKDDRKVCSEVLAAAVIETVGSEILSSYKAD